MATCAKVEPTDTVAVSDVLGRLETCYGRPVWGISHPPLDELILTILSQHTSDANCERAFASLRARFPDWEQVSRASDLAIADAIRVGGLASVKAPRIKMVVSQVLKTGALDDLGSLSLADAKSLLQSLPGVGPKTAACVLLFACHRPALPVDTHVYRVSHRIGLIDTDVSAESAHEILESLLDDQDVYSFHVNMINHGRMICRARSPRCTECSLSNLCKFASQGEEVEVT